MKKSFIKASLLITLLSVGVMTGCGPKECEHEGGTATCTELAVCTKCGESYGELAEHNYGTVFSHNDEQHWKECACGEKTEVANHEFVPGEIIEEATCTKEGTQLYTCVCGESKTEILPIKTHTYSTTYSYDENEHWFECECKDKKDVASHNFVEGEITKEATCSEPGIQLYNCICGATKEVELATVPHKDDDLDIYCDYGCKKKIVPEYDTLLSCKTANALANALISLSGNHYVKGEVIEVLDAKNGIFTIQDDSQETFKLRLIKGEGGIAYKDFECKVVVGDYVQAYGKVSRDTTAPYTPRMEGPIVEILEQHDHVYGEATCLLPATCECGHTSGTELGHDDLDGDGLCDRCAFDLSCKLSTLVIATKTGMTKLDDATLSWSNDIIEFQISKGKSSQLYTDEQEHARIYSNNSFAIYVKEGITIQTLKFLTTGDTYANNIIKALAGVEITGVLEGTNVVVENFNLSSIVVPNTASSIRLTGIEIVYKEPVLKTPTVVDFNTIVVPTSTNSAGDGSYKNTYTTASGWVTKNAAIQAGGASVMNPIFPVVGPDGTHKAVCLSGNVNATGTLTSPTLTGGLEQIDVDFTKMFSDTQLSVTITVTEIATGNVYTHTISRELPKTEKYQVYNDSWVLETPVEGDYTIVFTNDCPTGATSDKDRITLLKVEYK